MNYAPIIDDLDESDRFGPPMGEPANSDVPDNPRIKASPFKWQEPESIRPRAFVYGRHYIREFISTTIAPGGVGKTSLSFIEALAIVTGRPLLGIRPNGPAKVWIWNGEDPHDELQRRVTAAMLHYGISREEVEGKLFLNSGRDVEMVIAEQTKSGTVIRHPVVEQIIDTIEENKIAVMVIDPFVSSHHVTENDNMAIDRVVKTWGKIADRMHCSIDLVHHARKTGGGEISVEDGRGAVALLAAARSARVLNQMTKEEADSAGVDDPRPYFRVDNGKSNLAPPEATAWHKLEPHRLPNGPKGADGDSVAVVTAWAWPDPFDDVTVHDLRKVQDIIAEGEWAENVQAKNWAGKAVAQVLDLDIDNKAARAKAKAILKRWISNKVLRVESRRDQRQGRERPVIVVGERA